MAKETMTRSSLDRGLWLATVGLAAWAIPGAGHFLIRERRRGIILFVVITSLFAAGLYIGSVGVVDRVGAWPWFLAQIFFSPAVGVLTQFTQGGQFPSYGRPADVGQIYTGIAGLLNLLCISSAVYMAYCGRGEMIGHEEDDNG